MANSQERDLILLIKSPGHILDCFALSIRPLSSSFSGLPYRILNINHKQELLRAHG